MISSRSRLAGPATNQPVQPTTTLWPSKSCSRSVPTRSAQAMNMEFVWAAAWCRMLAMDRHPICGHADDVRALERLQPKSLGKPAIIADSDADAADRRLEHWKAEITRLEEQILGGPKMHFAEGADVARWPEHDRRIVERGPSSFGDAGDDIDIVATGCVDPGRSGFAGGHF